MAEEHLLITKLSIPPTRPSLVVRPRLYKRLNSGLNGKLTLVSAPAGYGKTTLVSSWIQQSEKPVSWLTLDDSDNDLPRFLSYFLAALQHIDEELGIDVRTALESSQSPQVQVLLTMLVNEIADHGKQFTLVIDDCHLITNQPVYDAVDFIINNQPSGMHLVIIGRVDPLIALSRLRAGGQLNEIRSDDLRFTKPEASEFLNELMDLDLTIEDIAVLEKRTEGWIVGLQLVAISLQGREDKHEFIASFSGIHHYIIDYLVEEVLNRQTEEIRSFLCCTSILDSFNASLCDATLGRADSRKLLQQLEGTNLFLIPLDEERQWFRYHQLFRDILSLCLQDSYSDQIPDLHRQAAGWYELNGFISEALKHLVAAKHYADAVELVELNAKGMMERSELASLMKWVDSLPQEIVRERSWLCIYHAWALRLSGRPYEAVESRIGDAENGLEKFGLFPLPSAPEEIPIIHESETRNMLAHIFALYAFQALFKEEIPRVIKLAGRAKSFRPEERFVWSSLGFVLGWAYRFSGDLEASNQAFNEAKEISLASGNIYMAVASLCREAYGKVMAGQLNQAVESLKEAENIATLKDGKQLPVAGYAYVYWGGIRHELNDLNSAEEDVLKGIDLCERVGYIMDEVVGYSNLTRLRIAQNKLDGAQEACQIAKNLSQKMKGYVYARRWVEDCQVRMWLAQGKFEEVARWVGECGMSIDDLLDFKRDIDHIILARALVALGRVRPESSHIENAISLLQRMWDLASDASWWGKGIEILVLQALAFHVKGNERRALESFETALTLAEPEGYIRTFLDEGEPMVDLLRLAASNGISPTYSRQLLVTLKSELKDVKSVGGSMPTSALVEPLSDRELEVLKMLATDLSGPEIAQELMVALSTIRYHTNNIYGKLAVHNRRAAVRRANELNLL